MLIQCTRRQREPSLSRDAENSIELVVGFLGLLCYVVAAKLLMRHKLCTGLLNVNKEELNNVGPA